MTKILLVEDDKSLREIYGVRLLAEGYDIVSAGDGEEALAMAIKERPHLIISDVMMPKISGFDMLDILRSTTETRTIKVIMMTALSSDDQRNRGEQLGADRYLVKSQVGIEDVVRAVHEVLGDAPATAPAAQPGTPQAMPGMPSTQPQAVPQPFSVQPSMPGQFTPPTAPMQPVQPYPQNPQTNSAAPAPQPQPSSIPRPTAPFSSPRPASLGERVIQPLSDLSRPHGVDMNELLDKELANEAPQPAAPTNDTPSANNGQQAVNTGDIDAQLDALIAQQTAPAPINFTDINNQQPATLPAQASTPEFAPTEPTNNGTTPNEPSTPAQPPTTPPQKLPERPVSYPQTPREGSITPPPRQMPDTFRNPFQQ
ncbi:MAG TPA: response regulator [Verrucomicrobiae bacterium]|nr:response regulator [Verrucomicrobiae bacterium]